MENHSTRKRFISRQGQLLKITKWLSDANANDIFLFAKHVEKCQQKYNRDASKLSFLIRNCNCLINLLTNDKVLKQKPKLKSIKCFLFKKQNVLSNSCLDSLYQYCNSKSQVYYSISTDSNHSSNNNETSTIENNQQVQQNKFPLLSLPMDILNLLGYYLTKMDGIQLGTSCHQFYFITQSYPFLHNNNENCNAIRLSREKIVKIRKLKADLWTWSVNCKRLCLYGKQDEPIIKKHEHPYDKIKRQKATQKFMNTIENIKSRDLDYHSNWFENLFTNVDYVEIIEDGSSLLSFLPIDSLLSLTIQKSKYTYIEKKPLHLSWHSAAIEKLFDFCQQCNDFLANKCDMSLKNIRKIGTLELGRMPSSLFLQNKHFGLFARNCKGLIFNRQLSIESMCDFATVFLPNMTRLQVIDVYFEERFVFAHFQNLARVNGYRFSMLNIANDILNDTCDDWIKLVLTENEIETFRVRVGDMMGLGIFDETQSDFAQKTEQVEHWFGELAQIINQAVYACINPDPLQVIFYKLANGWCREMIDKMKISINVNDNDITHTPINNGVANVKELQFGTLSSKFRASYLLFCRFNNCFRNSLCFGLLNWQNSVESFTFAFCSNIFDKKKNTQLDTNANGIDYENEIKKLDQKTYDDYFYFYKLGFENAIKNIMEKFDNLQRLSIRILFDTSRLAGAEANNNINRINRYHYTIHRWIDLFRDVFNKNFATMKKKGNKHNLCFSIECVLSNKRNPRSWNDLDECYNYYQLSQNRQVEYIPKQVNIAASHQLKNQRVQRMSYLFNLQRIEQRMIWCLNNANIVGYCDLGAYCQAVFSK